MDRFTGTGVLTIDQAVTGYRVVARHRVFMTTPGVQPFVDCRSFTA